MPSCPLLMPSNTLVLFKLSLKLKLTVPGDSPEPTKNPEQDKNTYYEDE